MAPAPADSSVRSHLATAPESGCETGASPVLVSMSFLRLSAYPRAGITEAHG